MPTAVGRPTKYDESMVVKVHGLCLIGLTNEEICKELEISNATLHNWMNTYPDFMDAIKRGKTAADAEVVDSLRNRALAGDTTACIFWLKNRQPQNWRDRRDVTVDAVPAPMQRLLDACGVGVVDDEKEEEES